MTRQRHIPPACGHCKYKTRKMHCTSPTCNWIRCDKCGACSGYLPDGSVNSWGWHESGTL